MLGGLLSCTLEVLFCTATCQIPSIALVSIKSARCLVFLKRAGTGAAGSESGSGSGSNGGSGTGSSSRGSGRGGGSGGGGVEEELQQAPSIADRVLCFLVVV